MCKVLTLAKSEVSSLRFYVRSSTLEVLMLELLT